MRQILLLCIFIAQYALAGDYPPEFKDFFTEQRKDIVVSVAGSDSTLRIAALVSYDTVTLHQAEIKDTLQKYLSDNRITAQGVDNMLLALSRGIRNNPKCNIEVAACPFGDEKFKLIFDFDKATLTIYVHSDLLVVSAGETQYHTAARTDNALVNQARLYALYNQDNDASLTLSNITTLGLPYGYLLFDTQYLMADNQLDIYRGLYDIEVDGNRAVFGYAQQDRVAFNSTDFLNDGADYTSFFAQYGSSRNLVKGGVTSLQSVEFFASQAGQLEVYQGERLLLTQVVGEGRHSISYSDLPPGTYYIRLVLRSANQTLTEEIRQVVNTSQFNLPVGAWDYVLTTGAFDDVATQDAQSWHTDPEAFATGYGQLRAAWRARNNIILAGARTGTQDDAYTQIGVNVIWKEWLNATYQTGWFSSADRYYSSGVTVGPVSLSTQRFVIDRDNRTYRLSTQLYDETSFFDYSAAYAYQLGSGSGYVTYTHFERDEAPPLAEQQQAKGDSLSLGWMMPLFGGTAGLNASYSMTDEDATVAAYWSYAFDAGRSTQMTMTTDKVGLSRSEASLSQRVQRGAWSGLGTVSTAKNRDYGAEQTLSGYTNGSTDWANVSSYGFINTSGELLFSGTLTGTQFVSAEGAGATHHDASSFIHVAPRTNEEANTPVSLDAVSYNVRREKHITYQGKLSDAEPFISLVPYTETEFTMDAESQALAIDTPTRSTFVYPGTIYTIKPRITPLLHQLFVLRNIDGKPVEQVSCDDCVSVEKVSDDGVFRVSYRANETVRLVTADAVCVDDPALRQREVIYSYCLPGLEEEQGIADRDEQGLFYLGRYTPTPTTREMLTTLAAAGLDTRLIEVGNNLYIYIQQRQPFTQAQRALLEASHDADSTPLLSVR